MVISIVVPVHNEARVIPEFHRLLRATIDNLPQTCEVWYVNDGSSDDTEAVITEVIREDERVCLINLSRNFGHQAALTAGLDFAEGDVVITMDGDGQHSPRYIPTMLDLFDQGFDVVLTQRAHYQTTTFFKRMTSRLFYPMINLLSEAKVIPGAADFRLMSREAVLNFRTIRESHRFLRALVTWMGFKWTILQIDASPRIAGRSKYSMRKMFRLAYEAIFSFGTIPIRLSIFLGILVLVLAFVQFLDPLILILTGRIEELVPGWTTLIMSVLVLGATQLITLAIVGQYIGLIYEEVKRRPIYLLRGKPFDHTQLNDQK